MKTKNKVITSAALGASALALVIASTGAAQAFNASGGNSQGEGKRGGQGNSLVATGTLTQAQATAVHEAMRSAHTTEKAAALAKLVAAGTITQAQADAVAAAAGERGAMRDLMTGGTLTQKQATAVREAMHATKGSQKDGVLADLVAAGTITQEQADAIAAHEPAAGAKGKGHGKGAGQGKGAGHGKGQAARA